MGATTYEHFVAKTEVINTPKKAFDCLVATARYDHGHSPYSGSIAQKQSFTMISNDPMTWDEAKTAAKTIDNPKSLYYHKDDPSACIVIHDEELLRFGWVFVGWVGC